MITREDAQKIVDTVTFKVPQPAPYPPASAVYVDDARQRFLSGVLRMEHVELHQAWTWDCDNCGRENYARAVSVNPDEFEAGELEEVADALGVGGIPGVDYEFGELHKMLVSQPEVVKCAHCGEEFSTKDSDDE